MTTTRKAAGVLGWDISTTSVGVGVRSADGHEDYAAVPMEGEHQWEDGTVFDLTLLPKMMLAVLVQLQKRGWDFSEPGVMSLGVRQHDLVCLDKDGRLLTRALSWQINKAEEQARRLNADSAVTDVVVLH